MSKRDPYLLIDEFLRGELSEEDHLFFQEQLVLDKELQNELNVRQLTHEILDAQVQMELSRHVTNLHAQNSPAKSTLVIRLRRFGIAASLILLCSFSVVIYGHLNLSSEALHERYYSHYEDHITVMGDQDEPMSEAMEYYNNDEYLEAIGAFNNILKALPDHEDAQFYIAMSYYSLDKGLESEKLLLDIVSNQGKYEHSARWYLALHYLKRNEIERCQSILKQILDEKGQVYKKQEAQSLQRKLSNPIRVVLKDQKH